MKNCCPSQERTLAELQKVSADAPFLALGQTVFWDEPVKSLVALKSQELGYSRRFVAGIHDTDYFAKHKIDGAAAQFVALPHNDTTTKGLWSAAGEFSALFGSETIVTKEALQNANTNLSKIQSRRPGYLDEITEAWGWRGVVSLSAEQRISAEKPIGPLFSTLFGTFKWAVDTSLERIAGPHRQESEKAAEKLLAIACDKADLDSEQTLASYYEALIPDMYGMAAGRDVDLDTTTTTSLLKFNTGTCQLPRFKVFEAFLDPKTSDFAKGAYNEAISGTEIYSLDRFGTGALPFDLYIPGIGRGTLRLGSRGGVVATPRPTGFSYKKKPETCEELARILEERFGPNCVLVGKAVTLIGMLSAEFVFVFHDGASSYVQNSRAFHNNLAKSGIELSPLPILRLRVSPWDSLNQCCAWFRLPPPLVRPFGVDELCGHSLAARWRDVYAEQLTELAKLGGLKRPLDLIHYLDQHVGGSWNCLAKQYEECHQTLLGIKNSLDEVKAEKEVFLARLKDLKSQVQDLEEQKGRHWREFMFGKPHKQEETNTRLEFERRIRVLRREIVQTRQEWAQLQLKQTNIVESEGVAQAKTNRDNIAFEAELSRARFVRDAIVASSGLKKAGLRPASWWFPLVCADGTWFSHMASRAEFWLEPLKD